MKLKAILIAATVLMLGISSSFAAIGWTGNIWPCSGSTHLPTDNINVYVQVWKDGCTPGAGQCADLTADLYFKKATDATFTVVAMSYNGEVGNNDEFVGTIPFSATQGGVNMDVYTVIYDASDGSSADWAGDQCGNGPWLSYVIQEGTSQAVTVHFSVDMSCVNPDWFTGGVFFTGDFLGWGTCNPAGAMTDGDFDGIWEGSYTFPGGSTTNHEYKFQRNDGTNCHWSPGGNFSFVIDDSNPDQYLEIQVYPCETWGPGEITGPGSFCVGLCCCDNRLWIPIITEYDPPIITSITVSEGCGELTDCFNPECAPGAGEVEWDIVQGDDLRWYLRLCLLNQERIPLTYSGCFCVTIDQILPVELNSFDAIAGNGEVALHWSTATETDNDFFRINRNGSSVAEVNSKGNDATGHDYVWIDSDVVNGVNYSYTLVAVALDGSEQVLGEVNATPSDAASVSEYSLSQNYPNPFNPSTSISYAVKVAGLVNITVFDVAGCQFATLVNEAKTAGVYTVEFNAAGLPSGIYMYRMEAGEFSAVQKMVLMK